MVGLQKQTGVYSIYLHLICVEYELQTFVATSDVIRLMAYYLKPNCIDVSLEKLLSTSDEIRIITNDMQLNCAEYGLNYDLLQLRSSVLTAYL